MPTQANRSPDLVALLAGWQAVGHGPLSRRLAHALCQLVDGAVLPDGTRLPPERVLATRLAVSRTTVTQALDELRADGHLRSRQGSGTFVVGPPATTPFGTRVAEHFTTGAGIDLTKGDAPDLSHLPPIGLEAWQLNAACGGPAVSTAGLPEMRDAIAALHTRGGVTGEPRPTAPEQIHVTAGSHQAIHLLVSTLASPGAKVAVPEHAYPGLFDILDACGARAIAVRMDRAGMVPESLERVLRKERPAVVYFQAGPQIPTGQTTTTARVRALARLLDDHSATVVEDTTVAPVDFSGVAPMLADRCRRATVVSTGSLSKIGWSGLRLGWLRGPTAVIEQSIVRHHGWDLGPSVPSQLLALQLLPHLDRAAAQRRERLAREVDGALAQVRAELPDVKVRRPDGNSLLWLEFPVTDSTVVVDVARRHGVRVVPGSSHASANTPGPFVRVDVDRPPGVVGEGIRRLASAWNSLAS